MTSNSTLKTINVALAGNPNSGKTTLFNALTGSYQHVGNYPGVTVEKKAGKRNHRGYEITFVDLPGTYSLGSYSLEEKVARDYIVNEKPDLIIDVIDASNLERNLYLALQLIELGVPLVVALNMSDEVERQGIAIDKINLSHLLNAKTVSTIASQEKGIEQLLDSVIETFENPSSREIKVNYGHEMEHAIKFISDSIQQSDKQKTKYPVRWLSLKLLENDPEILEMFASDSEPLKIAKAQSSKISKLLGDDPELIAADRRYGFVAGIYRDSVRSIRKSRKDMTEKIDSVLADRVLGFPIFLLMMWLTFQLTFVLGVYPMSWIDSGFNYLGGFMISVLPDSWLRSLIVDGIIGGVGGVVIFLPNILFLFLAIAFLEDTGYMARAAFIMDKVMHAIGLHGKSFVPMLIGFGCTVPAIMATRTLDTPKDRILTMLVTPLMSCGAKLPVYILLAGAFFPNNAGTMIFLIYLMGIGLAILMAFIFSKTIFKGPSTPFVMELPPYRIPTLKSVLLHMWHRARMYIRKAGTIILAASMVMWFLLSYSPLGSLQPYSPSDNSIDNRIIESQKIENSYAGFMGKAIEPALKPLGFNWRIGVALISGLVAKEVVVSTLGTVYALGETDSDSVELKDALRSDSNLTPLAAFALMLFVLIYVPCIASISVIYRESGSFKWALFTVGYTLVLAWIVTFTVYQAGNLLGLGA